MTLAIEWGRAETASADPVEMEFRQLERDIPSLYLINGLFLSAKQADEMAGAMAAARELGKKTGQSIEDFLQHHQKDLEQLTQARPRRGTSARLDSGAKPARGKDRAAHQKVRNQWQELIGQYEKGQQQLAARALEILTPAQRDIVDRFVPCFIPPQDFRNPERVGQAAEDTSVGEKILARLREAPADRWEQGREKALDHLVPYVMKKRKAVLTEEEIRDLRADLGKALDQMQPAVRAMKDADFELEKSNLVARVMQCDDAPGSSGGVMPAAEKAKIYLLNPGNEDILRRRAGGNPVSRSAEDSGSLLRQTLRARGKDFRAANLLTDLWLSPEQAQRLSLIVKAAITERQAVDLDTWALMKNALEPYRQLKQELDRQQPATATETNAHRFHSQVKKLQEDNLVHKWITLETQMDQMLSADQINYLIGFSAGKGAAAKGRDADRDIIVGVRKRAYELLDAGVSASAETWRQQRADRCQQFVEDCAGEFLLDRAAMDAAREIARVESVLDRARAMKPAELRENRDNLAAELCPRRSQPRPVYYGRPSPSGDFLEEMNPATPLLFSEAALKLLETKTADQPTP